MLKVRKEASFSSKLRAFPYQVETVEAIKGLEYAAIFHEQGLGKTKIAIDLALTWISENTLDSVIIVTKKALVRNWEEEITTHSHFKARTLDQDAKTLFYAFNTPVRLYLTHYEACKSAQNSFALFLKTRRVGAICDESQKIKNPDSAIVEKIKLDEVGTAMEFRDKLRVICNSSSKKPVKDLISGKSDFGDAFNEAEKMGGDNRPLQRIKSFRRWLLESSTKKAVKQVPDKIKSELGYELRKIKTEVEKLLKII